MGGVFDQNIYMYKIFKQKYKIHVEKIKQEKI